MNSLTEAYDVVVCGGGPAGLFAATAAARQGMKTALVERFGFFGGAATASLVVPISGFFKNGERVVTGLPWAFIERLRALGAAQIEMPKGHISVDPEYYKLIAQRMVLEAGVKPWTNCLLSGAEVSAGHILAVTLCAKGTSVRLQGKVFIDATGDGDLCSLAEIPTDVSPSPQPLSLCFELINVDVTTPLLRDCIHHNGLGGKPSCNQEIRAYLEAQAATPFGGPWFNTLLKGDRLAVNMTRYTGDTLDPQAMTQAECRLREDMFALIELLRSRYPEFAHCALSCSAVSAGAREGRHLRGLYRLTGDDVMAGARFDDTAARCAHIIDIHDPHRTTQTIETPPRAADIPYRAMVSPASDNLIAAGRLISADARAHASLRVQGTCMSLGQSAGLADAMAIKNQADVRSVRWKYDAMKQLEGNAAGR